MLAVRSRYYRTACLVAVARFPRFFANHLWTFVWFQPQAAERFAGGRSISAPEQKGSRNSEPRLRKCGEYAAPPQAVPPASRRARAGQVGEVLQPLARSSLYRALPSWTAVGTESTVLRVKVKSKIGSTTASRVRQVVVQPVCDSVRIRKHSIKKWFNIVFTYIVLFPRCPVLLFPRMRSWWSGGDRLLPKVKRCLVGWLRAVRERTHATGPGLLRH